MGFPSPSTAFPMPIPPKPPWYSTPTAITSLPTAAPNCNSLIESPTDTPHNIENNNTNNNNDRPDDDDDDVDCFPRQDKQPVLPQDISPTDTPRPSLIDPSDADDSTVIHDNRYYKIKAYDDNDDDDDDDDDAAAVDDGTATGAAFDVTGLVVGAKQLNCCTDCDCDCTAAVGCLFKNPPDDVEIGTTC